VDDRHVDYSLDHVRSRDPLGCSREGGSAVRLEPVTVDELAAVGLTEADVATQCPMATPRCGFDKQRFWVREELADLLGEHREGDE
jgi:hypothetical protein